MEVCAREGLLVPQNEPRHELETRPTFIAFKSNTLNVVRVRPKLTFLEAQNKSCKGYFNVCAVGWFMEIYFLWYLPRLTQHIFWPLILDPRDRTRRQTFISVHD